MLSFFNISNELSSLDEKAISKSKPYFEQIDKVTEYNQLKVLRAFIDSRVSESNFAPTTGYGYGDKGRDDLDAILAKIFGAEDALIRHTFASGTHTLTVALFGILRPGDKMLCVTGRPYDTLIGVLGCDERTDGSLADFGVEYSEVALDENGRPDYTEIEKAVKEQSPQVVYIQRSRGYSLRPSLSISEIEKICKTVKAISKDIIIMVDNCYGEFVEQKEPTEVGADLMAGSLIKNPGGGIAPCGGYIAGRSDLVEKCAYRMTAPGVGREVGASLGHNRELYMGIFNAPHVTGEALKAAVYAAALFSEMGYDVTPTMDEKRADIIQAILLKNSDRLIAFCKGLQSGAPVDSHLTPEPWDMPGYDDKVIMAAGAFTLGSSIELSADAPLREPFAVWMQGGLNFHTARAGILMAAEQVLNIK
ncbi:MAG: methionine gamma-lyase family protein [Clostridia bacterium]|nr:methionine gamma-lyase family protein [Clostridia bacterium]